MFFAEHQLIPVTDSFLTPSAKKTQSRPGLNRSGWLFTDIEPNYRTHLLYAERVYFSDADKYMASLPRVLSGRIR